jgi:K+-transporting ATPase ATPase C chain
LKSFFTSLKISIFSLLFFTVLLGVLYPLFIYGIGQLAFHFKAQGSIIYDQNEKPLGSLLIGQNFTKPQYFHSRPSSAGTGYDAANSSGSNLGPTSQKLIDTIKQRSRDYRLMNGLSADTLLPGDCVAGSGSGLDPHISFQNAVLQSSRVASARGMSQEAMEKLIKAHSYHAFLGLFGQKRVNVLKLNIALDQLNLNQPAANGNKPAVDNSIAPASENTVPVLP